MPWRKTLDPYRIWLSEIILQQTRVDQGMAYYLNFLHHFPTLEALAKAEEERVLKVWQGLGYYSRARNLHASAKYIWYDCKAVFPKNYKALLKLRGVGDYTASAIASICYNEPAAVVDGNVYRVLSRFLDIDIPVNSTKGVAYFKAAAQELIDKNNPGTHNQAVMELGATICKPRNPLCEQCVLQSACKSGAGNAWENLPVKEKRIKIKKRYFNFLVMCTEDQSTCLEQRVNGIWKNMYQFPLIESEGPMDDIAFRNHEDFQKRFSGKTVVPELFNPKPVVHKLSHQHLVTSFWIVNLESHKDCNVKWKHLKKFPVPVLIHNFLEAYKNS